MEMNITTRYQKKKNEEFLRNKRNNDDSKTKTRRNAIKEETLKIESTKKSLLNQKEEEIKLLYPDYKYNSYQQDKKNFLEITGMNLGNFQNIAEKFKNEWLKFSINDIELELNKRNLSEDVIRSGRESKKIKERTDEKSPPRIEKKSPPRTQVKSPNRIDQKSPQKAGKKDNNNINIKVENKKTRPEREKSLNKQESETLNKRKKSVSNEKKTKTLKSEESTIKTVQKDSIVETRRKSMDKGITVGTENKNVVDTEIAKGDIKKKKTSSKKLDDKIKNETAEITTKKDTGEVEITKNLEKPNESNLQIQKEKSSEINKKGKKTDNKKVEKKEDLIEKTEKQKINLDKTTQVKEEIKLEKDEVKIENVSEVKKEIVTEIKKENVAEIKIEDESIKIEEKPEELDLIIKQDDSIKNEINIDKDYSLTQVYREIKNEEAESLEEESKKLEKMNAEFDEFVGNKKNNEDLDIIVHDIKNQIQDEKEIIQSKETEIIKNNDELNQNSVKNESNLPIEFELNKNKDGTKIKNEEMVIDNENADVEINEVKSVREITIESIPIDITKEKIYEFFFIFGDIIGIEFNRSENKAFLKYKLTSSAERAVSKMKKEIYNPLNFIVSLSNPFYRSGIEGDDQMHNTLEGRVVFLKFSSLSVVPEIESLKKSLKKFGIIVKVHRKKEKKNIFIEFSNEASAKDLVKSFHSGKYNWNSNSDLNAIDYVYNKYLYKTIATEKPDEVIIEAENVQEEVQQTKQNVQVEINYNHHWYAYWDENYQRNYYHNPFLNETVWELPEGAVLSSIQNVQNNYQEDHIANVNFEDNDQPDQNKSDKSDSYYDDEAWDQEDLVEKMIWDRMKDQQLKEWMKRPARQQVPDTRRDTAYIEGNYDYNIWYDKYLTDRKEEREKIAAMHKINVPLDTGYTKADIQEKEGGAYFCMYFAKGCCAEGVNCRYYHRVPTKEDCEKIENLRDVFGRPRFATHRNDMGGVGTFTKECRTLYVLDIKMIDVANPVKEMVRVIYDSFSHFGEIEDINYIPTKGICFIRYSHRCSAEFAKEAMMDQSLIGEEILGVKWAYDDPNPMSKKRIEKEYENRFLSAHIKKQENLKKANKGRTDFKNFNNENYYQMYHNQNNPYAEQKYESGYGYDERNLDNNTQFETVNMTNNCIKLSETLKMIDENFGNNNN